LKPGIHHRDAEYTQIFLIKTLLIPFRLTQASANDYKNRSERQLDTAIKLFFENLDHLSCYTLAAVSREITDDLCEKQKSELYRAELERLGDPQRVRLSFRDEMEILIKPEHRKEVMRLLKKAQNFLKHADRDHDKELEDISAEEVSADFFRHKKLCTSSKANVSGLLI